MNTYPISLSLSSQRPLLRSLLQKAVRRGYADLSEKVAFLLARRDDSAWLHARTGVIVFEECWPCAHFLSSGMPSAMTLREVANSVKNKDAAGLGALAHAAAEGDATAINQAHNSVAVKIVAAGLKRSNDFFRWAMDECCTKEQAAIVQAARNFFSQASWPWDKAFTIAGAYLSIQGEVPDVPHSAQLSQAPFPFWTAVDKHTPQGKAALRRVAGALKLPEHHLQWASFYFESAKTNDMVKSPWWETEAKWRFRALGLDLREAEEMWARASPHVMLATQDVANFLDQAVENSVSNVLLGSDGFHSINDNH